MIKLPVNIFVVLSTALLFLFLFFFATWLLPQSLSRQRPSLPNGASSEWFALLLQLWMMTKLLGPRRVDALVDALTFLRVRLNGFLPLRKQFILQPKPLCKQWAASSSCALPCCLFSDTRWTVLRFYVLFPRHWTLKQAWSRWCLAWWSHLSRPAVRSSGRRCSRRHAKCRESCESLLYCYIFKSSITHCCAFCLMFSQG